MWEYITFQIIIIIIVNMSSYQSAHSSDNHQYAVAPSLDHVRFQLCRVGDCSPMIVLCDSWRRLMRSCVLEKTSVFNFDGGPGKPRVIVLS